MGRVYIKPRKYCNGSMTAIFGFMLLFSYNNIVRKIAILLTSNCILNCILVLLR